MTIQETIAANNKPELANVEGSHVYQVWEDGEITLTKCGSLLGQRILHTISSGDDWKKVPVSWFPEGNRIKNRTGEHAFIYTDEAGAKAVQMAILNG